MILADGYHTDSRSYLAYRKFGGDPFGFSHGPDMLRRVTRRYTQMTGYLWNLAILSLDDETDTNPDWAEGWARFGKRVLHWAPDGSVWHERFTSEDEAKAWCSDNYYESEDE